MESLVEAAKPVKAVNDRPVSDASQRRGRAFMADSLKLDPDNIVWHTSEGFQDARLPEAFLARHTATYSGYWKPRCRNHYLDRDFDDRPWPEYYARGESFEESGVPRHDDPANYWRYLGVGIPRPHSEPFSPAAENLVRHISRPGDATSPWCHAGKACPTTGVWFPSAIEGHPDAKIIDPYRHQRFITAGATMPDATVWGLPTADGIVWRLLEVG